MVRYNLKMYVTILVFLGCIFAVLFWYITGCGVLRSISQSSLVVFIISFVFTKWGWKKKCLEGWLVPFPNLNGKWKGILKSTYKEADKDIPAEIEITQNFFCIYVTLTTGESKSTTTSAGFNIDPENNVRQLCYTYHNIPKTTVQHRSSIHYGTAILDIAKDNKSLDGFYWTGRKTTGDMTFKKSE